MEDQRIRIVFVLACLAILVTALALHGCGKSGGNAPGNFTVNAGLG